MGQNLSSKLLFIYSPNNDGFYIFHISQGSVATQLRCVGMFSNHFIANFSQNAPVKNFLESVNIWQIYGQNFVAYFFGPPCISIVSIPRNVPENREFSTTRHVVFRVLLNVNPSERCSRVYYEEIWQHINMTVLSQHLLATDGRSKVQTFPYFRQHPVKFQLLNAI